MVRPTFLAFETAKRALNISQIGLDTVGHNISNAQTTGYTRQRVDQLSLSLNGTSPKYQGFSSVSIGMGSSLSGIRQLRDPYLDNRYRAEAAVNGELGIKQSGLTDINNIFDETMTDGLYSKFGDLLNSLVVLGQSANLKENAMVARDTANQLAQILNKNAKQLEEARGQQMLDLKISVEQDVNTLLRKIAEVNQKIKSDNLYDNPSNELNDERNMLLDSLSEYLDVKVVRTPVKISSDITLETVSIELNNSGNPPIKLVDGSKYQTLGVTEDKATGNAVVSLLDGISGLPLIEDLSTMLQKGGIKGFIDIINGEGPNSDGGNTYRGIPYYMKSLDEYAQTLAEVFNRVNNISEQESADSGARYDPVVTGTAAEDWMASFRSGTVDFGGKNTSMSFVYDGSNITATFTDENGATQNYTATYVRDGVMDFPDGSGGTAFSITTKDVISPETSTDALIDAGWPPVTATDGNKNLIVPLTPTVTDATGKQPAWIDNITGGVVQFSGKDYDIEFGYNNADGTMTAKMPDGTVYTGTYAANDKVDFRDANGAVMFTVKTTATPPDSGTPIPVKLDATINAKNISISQNWFDDPLYITATKSNAPDKKTASIALDGTKNPSWLNKVLLGPDSVAVPNGTYQFSATTATPPIISVKINGIVYSGEYKTNSTIELKGGTPEKVGLKIETNGKSVSTKDEENVATIRNDTGAKNDNINKLITELQRASTYSVSGINGNCQEFLVAFQSQMGLDMNLNTSLLDASMTVIGTLADRRDSISAVSVDEEGISMMTYQNYYNAAARYMTTLDEALDKIINGMGVVGR